MRHHDTLCFPQSNTPFGAVAMTSVRSLVGFPVIHPGTNQELTNAPIVPDFGHGRDLPFLLTRAEELPCTL